MVEVWKEAKGFEGYLEVSTKGNVRSIDRVITVHDGTRVYKKRIKGKVKEKQKIHKPDICKLALTTQSV